MSILISGCVASSPTTVAKKTTELRHEREEPTLLSEAEFMERVSLSATVIYEQLMLVEDAVKRYREEHDGELPPDTHGDSRNHLVDQGYLEQWPKIPDFAFTKHTHLGIQLYNNYDDLNGDGTKDSALTVPKLKLEVCEDFIRRYASDGFPDKIYDFEAAGKRYPGHTLGNEVRIYALSFYKKRFPDDCDIIWVLKYTPRVSKPRK